MAQKLLAEDVDTDAEKKRHHDDLTNTNQRNERCIPIFTRVSRDGYV